MATVAITGAAGLVGRRTLEAFAQDRRDGEGLLALDWRAVPPAEQVPGVEHLVLDVRSPDLADLLRARGVTAVVHLAAIVDPGAMSEEEQRSVDVHGTRNVVEACLAAGVDHLTVTSSGAAYGYHPDAPEWLDEGAPLRGNEAFAYSRHKRLVEELLARYRAERPELAQLVLRPGTILGRTVRNQITALFDKPAVLGLRGAATPFVFVWDEDVARCIVHGVRERRAGVFNLAGDGAVTLRELAARAGKRYVALPPALVSGALTVLRRLGLTRYGPEQVDFLRYRPILKNDALKQGLGYRPRLTSREAFDRYWEARAHAS